MPFYLSKRPFFLRLLIGRDYHELLLRLWEAKWRTCKELQAYIRFSGDCSSLCLIFFLFSISF